MISDEILHCEEVSDLMNALKNPPDSWWRVTCECVAVPLACVSVDHHFIWVNDAFSRLVGYSATELTNGMTWIDITSQSDIGGDLHSIKEVLEGKRQMYVMDKSYKRKRGEEIEIELTVFRFPPGLGDVVCFVAHAMPRVAYQKTVEDLSILVRQLQGRLERIMNERAHNPDERVSENRNSANTSGVNVTVGNTDVNFPKWVVGVVLALIFAAMYLAYIGGWHFHGGNAEPPSIPSINKTDMNELGD